MVEIQKLNKSFHKNHVLIDLDLIIDKPGIFAILGPNGSGKTTLIKSILGMVIPDSGLIKFRDENIKNQAQYRSQIDYLPQIADFPNNLRVIELIKMIKDLRGVDSDDNELIREFQIQDHLNKKLSALSGGTKQKVNLLLALMFGNDFIILDEPTTGLDPVSLIALKNLLNKEKANGKIILISSHIMSFVEEMADEIIFLLNGKIHFQGTIKNLKMKTDQSNFEHSIAELLKKNEHA